MPMTNPIQAGAGAALNLGAGLFKFIKGIKQENEGEDQLASLVRPLYGRPDEIKQLQRISTLRMMNPELAGGRLLEENIGANTAATIAAAKDFGSSADIYKAGMAANNASIDLGIKGAMQRLANEQQNMETLKLAADYSDKEFDTNKYIPFQEDRQDALSKIAAGNTNQNTGLDAIANTGTSFAGAFSPEGGQPPAGAGGGNGVDASTSILNRIKSPSLKVSTNPKFGFGAYSAGAGLDGFMGGGFNPNWKFKNAFGI